jgi:hypothetical protein
MHACAVANSAAAEAKMLNGASRAARAPSAFLGGRDHMTQGSILSFLLPAFSK